MITYTIYNEKLIIVSTMCEISAEIIDFSEASCKLLYAINFTEFPVTCNSTSRKNFSNEHQRPQEEEEEEKATAAAEEAYVEQSRFLYEPCQQLQTEFRIVDQLFRYFNLLKPIVIEVVAWFLR